MLKRFMTWLLRRLQGLMSALNGKRTDSRSANQDFRNDSDQASDRTTGQVAGNRESGDRMGEASSSANKTQSIDTSRPTVSVVEHLPNKLPTEPSADPIKDLPDAGLTEPDTHRRLDAAAAAPPTIETVTPSFPTNVSELLSSPTQPDESFSQGEIPLAPDAEDIMTPETSVRGWKKVADDNQLPGIHDVLPAVEPTISDEPVKAQPKPKLLAEPEELEPSPVPSQPPATEQAVLFSFDITERAADGQGDEPLAEESSDENLTARSTKDAPTSKVETLPYPWSLLVPEAKQQTTEDIPLQTVAQPDEVADVESKTIEATELTKAIAPNDQPNDQSDDRPVKNGIVKLLFTLKEGNYHGYIAPDDGSKDILFHQKYINADVFAHLERGISVSASVKYLEGKAYATRVDLL